MYSFYGGKYGSSFIIVKTYSSVEEMVNLFKQGPDYSTVHYDEHVLINTENKNNPENGRIYRRGYDFSNDQGGAIYIGTIVGPAGKAPMLELTTIDKVNEKFAEEGYDERRGEGSYKLTDGNLLPGKTEEGAFNDEIQWAFCSIRDPNEEDCIAYIGFKIPYLVIDFIAESVSPYYNRDNETSDFINENLSERVDDKTHPFYEKWSLKIPQGKKGDSFKNFRIITPESNTVEDYEGKDDDITNNRKILVYDYYNYETQESGNPTTIYLGDYNMIENIQVNDEGTLTLYYTHNNETVYNKIFKWIKSVTLDDENGHLKVEYNHSTDSSGSPTVYETDLNWVNDIVIAANGKVTLKYSAGKIKELDESLKWIESISLEGDGTLTVIYNDSTEEKFTNQIQWIDNISLTEEGLFTIVYNNGKPNYTTNLIWVRDITIADDGTVTIKYNNNTQNTYQKFIKTIEDITIQNKLNEGSEEGTGDQKVHVTYNTGESEGIGEPINYILETAISPYDYHYLVRYSDPVKRQNIIDSGQNYNYKGKNDWYDLGSVKDESGILIGFNLSLQEHPTLINNSEIIKYLNSTYPTGLTGTELLGKIVTVGDADSDKKFFAFDYQKLNGVYIGWYYVGSFSATVDNSKVLMINKESDSDLSSNQRNLGIGGIWFILED